MLASWAVSTVMTRQNSMPGLSGGQPAGDSQQQYLPTLIPLWDMANHIEGDLTTVFNVSEQQVEGSALMDFAKGEQIFIYYGRRRNSAFLTHNGFVYPDNQHDGIVLKLGLSSTDPLAPLRTKLLQLLECPADQPHLILPAPHFINPDLLAFVRIFNMNADQLDHWLATPDTVQDLKFLDCALDTELDSKSWTFLKMRLTLLLRVFGTTLADDEAAIEAHRRGQKQLGFVRAMLVQYRVLEKRLLTGALEYSSQRTKQ